MLFVNRLHSLRASERARASCFSSRCRSSRPSLRQLSRRSGSTASRTAQPGSDSWLQSEKRHVERRARRRRRTSPRAPRPPPRAGARACRGCRARARRREARSARAPSWCAGRARRRRGSPSSPARSSPSSAFTSVDLPTPEEPSRTTVRPGPRYGSSSSRPSPVTELTGWTGTPIATDSISAIAAVGVLGQVELRQHDHRVGAALPREREVPLEPARVQVAVEGHDEEHRVDVRRQRPARPSRCRRRGGRRRVRRGSTAWISPPAWATQSPTAGNSPSWRRRPVIRASTSPSSVART